MKVREKLLVLGFTLALVGCLGGCAKNIGPSATSTDKSSVASTAINSQSSNQSSKSEEGKVD